MYFMIYVEYVSFIYFIFLLSILDIHQWSLGFIPLILRITYQYEPLSQFLEVTFTQVPCYTRSVGRHGNALTQSEFISISDIFDNK